MCNNNNSERYFLITRTLKHEQEINSQIQLQIRSHHKLHKNDNGERG